MGLPELSIRIKFFRTEKIISKNISQSSKCMMFENKGLNGGNFVYGLINLFLGFFSPFKIFEIAFGLINLARVRTKNIIYSKYYFVLLDRIE